MTREEFEAIIAEVNDAKCSSIHAVEDECPLFAKATGKSLATGLNVDKHRWYEVSMSVYKCGNWLLGVNGVSDMFSESMDYDDCGIDTIAFEVEEVASVTYRPVVRPK